jgi:tetratricopeptide (TPR) repeat protein
MKTKIYSAMKKIFLLTIVFFKMSFVFGQTSADWSPWITADCYKGIKYKVANWGKVSGDYSDYYWGIMFQNTYSQPISFSYHFSVGNENPPTKYNYTVTYQIEPGGVYSNDGTKATAILFKSSSTNYKVSITDVCVGNCDSNYINCQGVPQNSVTNSSNSNSNSTNQNNAGENFSNVNDEIRDLQRRQSIACGKMQQQGQPFNNRLCTEGLNGALPQNDSDIRKYLVQLRSQVKELESMNNSNTTTQQNDLTDYNNSKADLERELAEHNSGIQKQNEENAIKGQIWDNAIKAGVDAHNSGNYTEAKNQFTIAINNSTNGQDRQNAQNYYDNSVKAEKSQEKIKAVTDLAQGVIQILGDAHENKMQKLNAEIDEMDRKQEIINNDQAINTLSDTKIFETYANYVAKNFEALNIKFEKLTIYKNEKNEKEAHLNFTGLQVIITNRWLNNKMQKYINVQSDTESLYKSIYNTPFFESLKKLDPYYNEELRQEIRTNTKGNNFLIYGLENTQPFIDVYDHGYKSSTYKGFNIILQNLENEAKGKLNKTDNAVETLLEKAKLFENGTSGVEKNYQKSLQFYQLAFDNSNDKNILIAIGKLYEKGDEFLPRNVNTAIAYYEKHITNNDNINPDAFLQLGSVYSENKSDVYNLEKAKNYFESQIALLEQKYNVTQNEEEKQEIKSKIARTYYLLGSHYNYSAKKYAISIAYYEKALQWNENDSETAYYIGYIYKGGLMGKNFDSTFKKDKKKIMYWREKVCEIYSRIATQNDNSKTNVAKVYCDLAKQNLK